MKEVFQSDIQSDKQVVKAAAVGTAFLLLAAGVAPLLGAGLSTTGGEAQAGYYLSDQSTDNGALKAGGSYLGAQAGETVGYTAGAYAGVYVGAKYGGFAGAYAGGPIGAAAGTVIGGVVGAA